MGKVAEIVILAVGNIGFIDVKMVIIQLYHISVFTNPKAIFLTTESISEKTISKDEDKSKRNSKRDFENGF